MSLLLPQGITFSRGFFYTFLKLKLSLFLLPWKKKITENYLHIRQRGKQSKAKQNKQNFAALHMTNKSRKNYKQIVSSLKKCSPQKIHMRRQSCGSAWV